MRVFVRCYRSCYRWSPVIVFTGDALFVNEVGRTDLYGENEVRRLAEIYSIVFSSSATIGWRRDHLSCSRQRLNERRAHRLLRWEFHGIERIQNPCCVKINCYRKSSLTIGCNGHSIGIKTKEVRNRLAAVDIKIPIKNVEWLLLGNIISEISENTMNHEEALKAIRANVKTKTW